jgi:hypothetical protein
MTLEMDVEKTLMRLIVARNALVVNAPNKDEIVVF